MQDYLDFPFLPSLSFFAKHFFHLGHLPISRLLLYLALAPTTPFLRLPCARSRKKKKKKNMGLFAKSQCFSSLTALRTRNNSHIRLFSFLFIRNSAPSLARSFFSFFFSNSGNRSEWQWQKRQDTGGKEERIVFPLPPLFFLCVGGRKRRKQTVNSFPQTEKGGEITQAKKFRHQTNAQLPPRRKKKKLTSLGFPPLRAW